MLRLCCVVLCCAVLCCAVPCRAVPSRASKFYFGTGMFTALLKINVPVYRLGVYKFEALRLCLCEFSV